ncbi:MAG: hypothetical protein ABIZ81_10775 [Opitutaceae bacterium]
MTHKQIVKECVEDFLSIEWGEDKTKIRLAVREVVTGSDLSNTSLAFLLDEIGKLPASGEPARMLNNLVSVSAAVSPQRKRAYRTAVWPRKAA